MESPGRDEQVQQQVEERERMLAEIEFKRQEAARKERERQEKLAVQALRAKEAAEAEEERKRQLEHEKQIEAWRKDPFSYAEHFGYW